jgi:hypothetical protein
MKILSYNVSWECMTNSSSGSAGELGYLCMKKSKNNYYCKNNFIHFLKNSFNNESIYDIISLQEASNLFDIQNLLPELNYLNYDTYKSTSKNEIMITIFNKNKFKIIKKIYGEFKSGRPLQIFIIKNLMDNENIIFVNLHYCTLNINNKECLSLTDTLTYYLKKINPNYQNIYYNYRIIITGDFNHDINIKFPNKYNLKESENSIIFKPFKYLKNVGIKNPQKTCCHKKNFTSKIEYKSDFILDSKILAKNNIVYVPLFLKEISDHLPIEAIL